MPHDDEDGSGTSNYNVANTGNDNIIYIEWDSGHIWGGVF